MPAEHKRAACSPIHRSLTCDMIRAPRHLRLELVADDSRCRLCICANDFERRQKNRSRAGNRAITRIRWAVRLIDATVPEMLKVSLFFDEGRKSFILIWSATRTEGSRTLRPPSGANAEANVDRAIDGVKDWIDDGIPSVAGGRRQRTVL